MLARTNFDGLRVLLIPTDRGSGLDIVRPLAEQGCVVITAEDPPVEAVRSLEVDIAILDARADPSNALADALAAAGVPILLVAGNDGAAKRSQHIPLLRAPVSLQDLLATMHSLLWLGTA
jgi:hypothetical protein